MKHDTAGILLLSRLKFVINRILAVTALYCK